MKKPLHLFIIICMLFLVACKNTSNKKNNDEATEEAQENKIPLKDRIDLAWAQEKEMTKDLSLGYAPTNRLLPAWEAAKETFKNPQSFTAAAIADVDWLPLGPKNLGGRTRTMCIDLNDATRKTVFAGSVGGGLWRTNDITQAEPQWQPINDFFANIAITSIAQDPANTQNIYFSTGEGYGNSDATRGLGIWKSADAGVTWAQLPSTNNNNFNFCQKLIVTNNGILFAATSTGLFRSDNQGETFTKVLGAGLGITGANDNFAYDVEEASNGDIYASLNRSLHKSIDNGVNWGAAIALGITAERIEIALAPNDPNYVYVLCEASNVVSGIGLSTNAGANFTTQTEPNDADTGIPDTDFSRSQAWYDLCIAVDPNDKNTIFVGGVDLFKSSNGGASWQQISHWFGGFGFREVHADQHNIVFSPNSSSVAYFVNDGGIYRTTNATAAIPLLLTKENNYNTAQFYSCAMDPTANSYNFLAGAQDNGSSKFTRSLVANTTEVTGGDGMFCHIDQNESQFWYTSFTFNSYSRSSNGGASFTSLNAGGSFTGSGRFVNPTDYDDVDNKMYCASATNTYLRWDDPQVGDTFISVSVPLLNGRVSAVKVSPNNANVVYFASGGGTIIRVTNANATNAAETVISTTDLPTAYVSCIEVQTGNDDHILVTYSNYGANSVWETTNGGANWTSVEGNLPDMPIRWAIFSPNSNTQAILATELGIWTTDGLNGTNTVWGASNSGLANVRVDMLQIRQSDKLMIAATHGRGLFYSSIFSPVTANYNNANDFVYPQIAVQFTNTSIKATSSAWNFGDGTTSTVASPQKKYTTPGTYNVVLSINGGASTIQKTITVMPRKPIPYLLAQGGDFETNNSDFTPELISGTGWQKGNSTIANKDGINSGANAWVTDLTNNYEDGSEANLYTPEYSFAAAGVYNFSFFTKYNVEAAYDGFRIESSIDTGKTWQPVGTTVAANWYNFANPAGNGGTAFTDGEAFFSGNFGTAFVQKNYDVSYLAGNNKVAFRFVFKSDGGVTGPGVAIDDVEITGPVTVLPVNIINFTAAKINRDAQIKWVTANELNVAYYQLERSWDAVNFATITKVVAQNNTSNTYSYIDKLSALSNWPNNMAYYRLKSVDNNTASKLSNVVVLSWVDVLANTVTVSPNPFVNYLQINGNARISSAQLVGLNGQILFTVTNVNNGRINIPATIKTGTYLLKLNTDKGNVVKKVVKN